MIYLQLFWVFFRIGLFTIGGGYAMIPLINAEVIANNWLDNEMLINFIAISESTPGPFAVNIATFVGTSMGGFWGAVVATLGVVMPSFIIILFIAMFFRKINEKQVVKDAFFALRPAVIGLIFFAFFNLSRQTFFGGFSIKNFDSAKNIDIVAIIIFAILFTLYKIPYKIKAKSYKMHPIVLIALSAAVGVVVYGVILK